MAFHVPYSDVRVCIDEINLGTRQLCRCPIEFVVDMESCDGKTSVDVARPVGSRFYVPMVVSVGVKSALDNIRSDGFVRDEDAVWLVFQAFHERVHAWQHSVGYMQKDPGPMMRDMARMRAVGACFPEYKKSAYLTDLSELQADRYATAHTKAFFDECAKSDSRFAAIDVTDILIGDAVSRRGSVQTGLCRCSTVDDVCSVYDRAMASAPYDKHLNIAYVKSLPSLGKDFRAFMRHTDMVLSVLNAANGREETEQLCRYVGRVRPECFRGLLCIQDEYCRGVVGRTDKFVTKHLFDIKARPWVDLESVVDGPPSGLPKVQDSGHDDQLARHRALARELGRTTGVSPDDGFGNRGPLDGEDFEL